MKLYYSKILLFLLPLNILLTSYHAHNNNDKSSITRHHSPKYISRVLSEGDIQSSNYNNDEEMKSVKERFDDRTSERFEEYEERMKEKRQKHKEERDKNIQKIIEKDKMDKLLEQKIEKGCLMCGCGLGGVAASVGIFGTVAVKELTKAAITAAMVEGEAASKVAGAAKGAEAFKSAVIEGIKTKFGVSIQGDKALVSYFTAKDYTVVTKITQDVHNQYQSTCLLIGRGPGAGYDPSIPICTWVAQETKAARQIQGMIQGNAVSHTNVIRTGVEKIVSNANAAAETAADTATKESIKSSTLAAESTYASCQTAIIASVVAIIIIALVMIIIYLVLRYRRKKKIKKKAEYTKLLKE
ncbi:rifin PIR protein, putative [Plasmodium reichenowi]|uniref:Rifin PIR protein, putative n=1 Tax=Plasmodium reichenowi TaxID=5854 RepID=A0A2P9DSC3_PLARE|nr:rifin PIR protein, putative [Plasmodium reichenowi]